MIYSKNILVQEERMHSLTKFELLIIDTLSYQRLRTIRQLGNSYFVFPTAEHSRFPHSLGVSYWAAKILESLGTNRFAKRANSYDGNIAILDSLDRSIDAYLSARIGKTAYEALKDEYDIQSFALLARVYALLHDLTHVPFGHTLEDQIGLFPRHDEDIERIEFTFTKLRTEVSAHPELVIRPDETKALKDCTLALVDLAEATLMYGEIICKPQPDGLDEQTSKSFVARLGLPTANNKTLMALQDCLLLAFDITSNTISADLLDYTVRDTTFASIPQTVDWSAALGYIKFVEIKATSLCYVVRGVGDSLKIERPSLKRKRMGVAVGKNKIRHDVITSIMGLLRIRYDLTEKVYYHSAKVIADSMLEKVLRTCMSLSADFVTWKYLIENELGDEGFVIAVQKFLKDQIDRLSKAGEGQRLKLEEAKAALKILLQLRSRHLFKVAYRVNRSRINEINADSYSKIVTKPELPVGRTELETQLAAEVPGFLDAGSIIVVNLPQEMQKKRARAHVEWISGQVFELHELKDKVGYSEEATHTTERYESLWSFSVLIAPDRLNQIDALSRACATVFGVENSTLLANYNEERYRKNEDMSKLIHLEEWLEREYPKRLESIAAHEHGASKVVGAEEVLLGLLDDYKRMLEENADKGKRKGRRKQGEGTPDFGFEE